jgi:tRNA pseudouridine38-40 synthase
MNLKLILSYDGTHYLGWQKTKMGPSIEDSLERVLNQILQEKIHLQAASRTDAGVHAEAQVVNFYTQKEKLDLKKLERGLNGLLPKDISISQIEIAPDTFHPTLDALGKEYHYYICHGPVQLPFHRLFSWHYPSSPDLLLMQQGASLLLGLHDFQALCNQKKNSENEETRCHLMHVEIEALPERRLRIRVIGDKFLYNMVRNLVGTLIYLGCGKLSLDSLRELLESRDRTKAGMTAPPHGLILKKVLYNMVLC